MTAPRDRRPCPTCGRDVSVTQGGRLFRHDRLRERPGTGPAPRCAGSGADVSGVKMLPGRPKPVAS